MMNDSTERTCFSNVALFSQQRCCCECRVCVSTRGVHWHPVQAHAPTLTAAENEKPWEELFINTIKSHQLACCRINIPQLHIPLSDSCAFVGLWELTAVKENVWLCFCVYCGRYKCVCAPFYYTFFYRCRFLTVCFVLYRYVFDIFWMYQKLARPTAVSKQGP